MLILQRNPGQSLWIGKDIKVILLGNYNGITHIGIEAPSEIKIVRDEISNKETGQKHE